MLINKICIVTGGLLSLLMFAFHIRFYKLFGWADDFGKISLRNQRILYTVHIALLLLFLVFAVLSFLYIGELSSAKGLAFGITILYSLFWLWRAIWQIVYFTPKAGKTQRRMPAIHYVLITGFFLLFITYLIPPLKNIIIQIN
ncbi:hypothetical protein K9N50_03495 [bacterium]|nr:hypothetical protein [bacterium]